MTDLLSDLKTKYRNGGIVIQLIFINVGIFIITSLIQLVLYLFNLNTGFVPYITSLPAELSQLGQRPWSLITYMFMHSGIFHLFFNMIILYWFGQFFLNFFSAKHLRGLYIFGGLVGGVFFIAAFHIFPIFKSSLAYANLIGASAAVLAITIAIAYKAPNQSVRLLLVGSIKLKYLALIIIAIDLLTITSDNPGGHIAHLGGAFGGYLFAAGLSKGWDFTHWINIILDIPLNLYTGYKKQVERRKQKLKVVKNKNYSKRAADYNYNTSKKASSQEIDLILDKIKESGYANLTEEEKKKLFDADK